MVAANEIVAEAESVAEARLRAERQVPRGMQVLSVKENWPHTGTVHATGERPDAAQERARAQVPEGASVVSEMVRPVGEAVYVYAADEEDAVLRLRALYGDALAGATVSRSTNGRSASTRARGPASDGHSNGHLQFCAELGKPFAEVSYRTKARVALRFGPPVSPRARRAPRSPRCHECGLDLRGQEGLRDSLTGRVYCVEHAHLVGP